MATEDTSLRYAKARLGERACPEELHSWRYEPCFTYVEGIVYGVVKVIDNPSHSFNEFDGINPNPVNSSAPHKIYNIGNNAPVSLMDFIETIEESMGKKAKKQFLPMQVGDVQSTYADTSDLINSLGYKTKTDLKTGIQKFISWYKKYEK